MNQDVTKLFSILKKPDVLSKFLAYIYSPDIVNTLDMLTYQLCTLNSLSPSPHLLSLPLPISPISPFSAQLNLIIQNVSVNSSIQINIEN